MATQPYKDSSGRRIPSVTTILSRSEDGLNQWMGDRQAALDRLAEVSPDKHNIAVGALARRRAELKPSIKNLPPTISRRALETIKIPRD